MKEISELKDLLLTEQLRPQKIEHLIILDRIKKILFNDNGKINLLNYLFIGTPGIGKTSTAFVIAKNYDNIYINVSLDRGLDTVRETIVEFATTNSMLGIEGKKIVILDELDGGNDFLFKALRATMEQFSSNVRFIATCNYKNKIPDAIISRFTEINFNPQNEREEKELYSKVKERINLLIKKLNLKFENNELIEIFLRKNFPDIRKIISNLQDLFIKSKDKVITYELINHVVYKYIDIFKLIFDKNSTPENNFLKLNTNKINSRVDEIFFSLSDEFFKYILEEKKEYINLIGEMMVIIADWDYKRKFMVDEFLALNACIYMLQKIINNKK